MLLGVPLNDAGNSVDILVCSHCGRIEFFIRNDSPVLDASLDSAYAPAECPRCNMLVRAHQAKCDHCGWLRPEAVDEIERAKAAEK
jgi:DNA-directed RNA polymerase subunit RPC12/RpoP